jgi:hypothetical protein
VQYQIVHEFPNYQFPFKASGIFLKKTVVKHQKRGVMLPVRPGQGREKIFRQNRKNA